MKHESGFRTQTSANESYSDSDGSSYWSWFIAIPHFIRIALIAALLATMFTWWYNGRLLWVVFITVLWVIYVVCEAYEFRTELRALRTFIYYQKAGSMK
jgi:hypothetical protein